MSDKSRYTESELQEFQTLLQKKVDVAVAELSENKDQLQKKNSIKFNYLEDSALMAEREYLNNQANRQQKFINHLHNALKRIENKTYGICRETGNLISKERLMAVPHATLSIEAKKARG
jgi:DnaK suppressor protein